MKREDQIAYWVDKYNNTNINKLALEATNVREEKNGNNVYFNRNFHLEPSNVCIHRCKFCSFRRDNESDPGSWSMTYSQVADFCKSKYTPGDTEIHIVGSVHPNRGLDYYLKVIEIVRETLPKEVAIKAYSAVEIDDMSKLSGLSIHRVLSELKDRGLDVLPGGGAEIFNREIREIICPDKCSSERWLEVHKTAHSIGIKSNATMLYGHIENLEHRIEHLLMIKDAQNESFGFDAFIPLKFRNVNNSLSHITEINIFDTLKTFAISRLILDNVAHIKSYWPMLGKELCQLTLLYGADDIDGTIKDSTKIYSMAGSIQSPQMSIADLQKLANNCGYTAIERDSFYNQIIKK